MAVALTATLSANAGFFNGNNSWDNPWNNTTTGDAQDNGVFKYNAYDMWDPRWFAKETENMFIIHPLINIGYKTDNNNLKVDDIKEIGNKKFCNTTKNANPLSKEEIRIFLNNYNLL